jgi:hypothetical protein
MAAMSATTTSRGAKAQVTPSFHVGGEFVPDDEEFGDFMLNGMALTEVDMTLEAFAHTWSQTATPKDAPRGASPSLDPQRGEGNRQAWLPESFTLDEMVPTSSMVPPSRMEALSNQLARGGARHVEASGVVYEAATLVCQASIFSATMMVHPDFSPTAIFKMAATMYELGNSMVAKALKTKVQAEEAEKSQEDTVQGLLSAATHVKTMPTRPAIERSSIIPRVVVVDNFQGIFQLVGPKG